MTPDQLQILVQELLKLLASEREKSHELTMLLLEKTGQLSSDINVTSETSKDPVGKMPWNIQKDRLERKFSKKVESINTNQEVKQDAREI